MTQIAVVGATGVVGETILSLLAERGFSKPHVYGSTRSRGQVVAYGSEQCRSKVLWDEPIPRVDLAFFAADEETAIEWAPKFIENGAVVIDNSSAFRLDPAVPLIVPEANGERIHNASLIANPNCSTILLVLTLAPLRALGAFSASVATYQAVSGAGKPGLDALEREVQAGQFLRGDPFPFPISRNLFPLIGSINPETGRTGEEQKMVDESRRILDWPEFELAVTCVRVPVERCHSEAVALHFQSDVRVEEAVQALASAPGVELCLDPEKPPVPVDVANQAPVFVGRLRQSGPRTLEYWLVGDQVLKRAALNAVQIADRVLAHRAPVGS